MSMLKRYFFILTALLLGFAFLYFAVIFTFVDLVAEHWWFSSLGYGMYFWKRQLYRYLVFAISAFFFFLLFFLNLWLTGRFLRHLWEKFDLQDHTGHALYQRFVTIIRYGSSRLYLPLAVILAFVIALPIFRHWQDTLLYLAAPSANVIDPVFKKDVSFYLFSFPVYILIKTRLLIAFTGLLVAVAAIYLLGWKVTSRTDSQNLPLRIRAHLTVLITLVFAVELWDQFLARYKLLYRHPNPLFFGPTYVDMKITLPLIWLSIIGVGALGLASLYYLNRQRGLRIVLLLVAFTLMCIGLQKTDFLRRTVQTYVVKPNEVSKERSFIQNSIQVTLSAYKLTDVETRRYPLRRSVPLVDRPEVRTVIRNIPVWDGELLLDVFRQLQEIRPYYDFVGVDVDRYFVQGVYHQVYLGAREINLEELPASARNWINKHLKYTHGEGAVMTPAAQDGEEPITWFLRDIPPQSDVGLSIKQPAIYYGLEHYDYVIAPSEIGEMDFSRDGSEAPIHYDGKGGIPLGSLFKKLFYAFYFKNSNILFTTKTSPNSRILYRRNIIERVKTITPFFIFDSDPYLVVTTKGLYWILDGYTTSDWYPNAEPCGYGFNYIRDAVKVVVDAYNGTVDYYICDKHDPIILAYKKIYPTLLKNLEEMPSEIRKHLRYPRDFFEIQMQIYAKYHQMDPERFYNQEDRWQLARVYEGEHPEVMRPYYVTLNLFNIRRQEFLLISAMSPKGLDTLRALAVAGCDGDRYGKISIFVFPKGTQVFGPSQINALIDQDTTISQEFTLWNQIGSAVERGRITILPVQGTLLYIQPVYLKSSARLKIPELKRLIVSQGDYVVMDRTLERAFNRLEQRIQRQKERLLNRTAPLPPARELPANSSG